MIVFSALYWALAVAVMPFLFAGELLLLLVTFPFDRRRLAIHLYSCAWGSLYVWMNPLWRMRVEGRSKLPWRGPAVLVANHVSLVDILVLYGLFRPFKWVAKAELFKVPFVGWVMFLNDYVRVLRGDRESIRKMMDHCRRHLAAGSPVLLFPEGTRSADGVLQGFKEGAFRLAWEADVPVVPIALTGTLDGIPKRGLVLRRRMRATARVLDPISPRAYPSVDALRDAVREAIAEALPPEMRGDERIRRAASGRT